MDQVESDQFHAFWVLMTLQPTCARQPSRMTMAMAAAPQFISAAPTRLHGPTGPFDLRVTLLCSDRQEQWQAGPEDDQISCVLTGMDHGSQLVLQGVGSTDPMSLESLG